MNKQIKPLLLIMFVVILILANALNLGKFILYDSITPINTFISCLYIILGWVVILTTLKYKDKSVSIFCLMFWVIQCICLLITMLHILGLEIVLKTSFLIVWLMQAPFYGLDLLHNQTIHGIVILVISVTNLVLSSIAFRRSKRT